MAKRKKSKKKVHRRHSSAPAARAANAASPMPSQAATPAPATAVAAPAMTSSPARVPSARRSYVGGDIRRIGMLASLCVVAELVLWYLFTYTSLGASVYSLVK